MVYDYGRRTPTDQWDRQKFDELKRLIDSAKRYDDLTKQPDCEDPAKAAWMREVEERLRKLELAQPAP